MNGKYFETLYLHRELLLAWTSRIIKARYQQSILGGLWAIIQPVFTAVIFSVIFTFFVPINTGGIPYIVFSFTAMVPWMFFSSSILDMVDSLVINMNLIGKIYFPREILPISASLARFFDFVIASLVLGVLILYFRIQVHIPHLMYFPLIVLTQFALIMGLGLFGSALNVFYRDVRHLFMLGLQIWMYASPIIYPASAVPDQFQSLYFLNPMAGIIQAYRDILLNRTAPGPTLYYSMVFSTITLLIGYWLFKRSELQFADAV
jgi:lipopolysaccharide transport system permease protein